MGSTPITGPITISTGVLTTSCVWSVVEFNGIDTSGTDGSGAIVQSSSSFADTTNTLSVSLNANGNPSNGVFAAFGAAGNAGAAGVITFTPSAGFTEIDDTGVEWANIETMWRSDNSTSAATTTNVVADGIGGIAIEIKAFESITISGAAGSSAIGSVQ